MIIAFDQILSLAVAASLAFVIQILVFLCFFRHLDHLYWPRVTCIAKSERIVLKRPEHLLAWIKPLFTSEHIILEKCGLDSYLLIRYISMLLKILLAMTIMTSPLLPFINGHGGAGYDGTAKFSILNLFADTQHYCWIHVFAAVVVVAHVCRSIQKEQLNFINTRKVLDLSPRHRNKPSLATIIITNIPESLQSEFALQQAFFKYPGGIRNVSILRDYSLLEHLVAERDAWLRKLEWAETCLIRSAEKSYRNANPRRPEEWSIRARQLATERGLWTFISQDWQEWHDQVSSEVGSVICHHDLDGQYSTTCASSISDADRSSDADSIVLGEPHDGGYGYEARQKGRDNQSWISCHQCDGGTKRDPPRSMRNTPPQSLNLWRHHLDDLTYEMEIISSRKNLALLNETILETQKGIFPRRDTAFVTFNTQFAAITAAKSPKPFGLNHTRVEVAPNPHDIRWEHLSRPAAHRRVLRHCNFLLICLPFIWLPAVITEVFHHYNFSLIWSEKTTVLYTVQNACLIIVSALSQYFSTYLWSIVARKKPYLLHTQVGLLEYELNFAWSLWWGLLIALVPSGILSTIKTFGSTGPIALLSIAKGIIGAADWYLSLIVAGALSTSAAYVLNLRGLLGCCLASISTPRQVWEQRRQTAHTVWAQAYISVQSMALSGLFFAVSAPLIVPLMIAPCVLVVLALRYNIIYTDRQQYDTHGVYFIRALYHIFVGLYLMEILLFLILSDVENFPGYSAYCRCAVMGVLFLATVTFHVKLQRDLTQQMSATDWLEDEDQANDGAHTVPTVAQAHETRDPLDDTLPGAMTLQDLWSEEREALINAAYAHPSSKIRRAVVWIPRDNNGLSDDEILLTEERYGRWEAEGEDEYWKSTVMASNNGAAIGANGAIVVAQPPPDFEQMEDIAL